MSKKYRITKRFFSGLMIGLECVEDTNVVFFVGFRCENAFGGSGYEIVKIEVL